MTSLEPNDMDEDQYFDMMKPKRKERDPDYDRETLYDQDLTCKPRED